MAIGKEGNVKWVDGLRGVASASVVITHLPRAFDHDLFGTVAEGTETTRFLQLPIIRVWIQGRLGVAIFSFVTGYVCALKPIRLSRQGNQEAAFVSMGKSALRRVPRLILPTTLSTIIIWFLSQLGAFNVTKHCDSRWLRDTVTNYSPTFTRAINDLLRNLMTTWTKGGNQYEPNQWTLMPLLKASMQVYVFMLATAHMQPKWRMFSSLAMFCYFWAVGDSVFGMPAFFGVFLSDLHNHGPANEFVNRNRKLGHVLSVILFFISFWLGSYPESGSEKKEWATNIGHMVASVTPNGAEVHRFSSTINLVLMALSLHFAPGLRDMLSNRYFLWLGKVSFAVYLLHGFLERSLLVWMVYGFNYPENTMDDDGNTVYNYSQYPGHGHLTMCLVAWIPFVYFLAFLWTTHVDPWAARMTERIVSVMNGPREEKHRLPA